MAAGTVTITVRPLRFAFLVDPGDRSGLQKAIEINTFLWGGTYNPILPAFHRTPKKWEAHKIRLLPTPDQIIAGYLDGFDPDFVVPVGKCSSRKFITGHRDVLTPDEVLGKISEDGAPGYGIGLIDLLNDFAEKELKFTRTKPIEIFFPRYSAAYRLFLTSVFGVLPHDAQKIIDRNFLTVAGVTQVACTIDNFADLLAPGKLFPRRLNSWLLKGPIREPQLFVCDATSTLDVIDYWNLRAAGYYVVPIPIQAAHCENVKVLARKFIENNYRPYKHNPKMYHHTTVQMSRSLSEETVRRFTDSLKVQPSKFSIRWWYPRLWDSWARERTSESISFQFSHETEIPIAEGQTRLELRSQDPKLDLTTRYSGHRSFANQFSFRFYGAREPMAEVFPEGSRELSSAIGRIGYYDWRFSKSGPVFLVSHGRSLIFIDLPRSEAVMREWLRERGWQVELSGPGRIANQIIKQLGGSSGISFFSHEGVIRLLQQLEAESGMPRQAVVETLKQVIKTDDVFFDAEHYLRRLLEFQALRLGVKIKCPVCTRYNWFELDELDYALRCKYCLSDFSPPLHSPKKMEWTYRAHGPFAIPVAQGGFSVLLTLHFLEGLHHPGITPLFSYTAKHDGKVLEVDFTCLYRTSTFGETRTYVVHAECKSFNEFETKDFDRMDALADAFPGAVLIFSTFNRQLGNVEKKLLCSFVLKERRKRLRSKPHSPVIVLTGNELFSIHGAPMCWKGKGAVYDKFAESHEDFSELPALADATQQLHLGLPSWWNWAESTARKRKRTEKAELPQPGPSPIETGLLK